MLYTFAKAHYDQQELAAILNQVTPQDAVLLWQDGVLLAVRYAPLFANLPHAFVLENDVMARNVTVSLPALSLSGVVKLSEDYFPQFAL